MSNFMDQQWRMAGQPGVEGLWYMPGLLAQAPSADPSVPVPAPVNPAVPPEAPPEAQPGAVDQTGTVAPGGTTPGPATPGASGEGGSGGGLLSSPIIPIALVLLILYVFVFRSKRNEDKKRQDMLSALKKGDRVQTIGGMLGTVIEARESDVLLKVDESNNTKIRFTRNAIHRVIEEEKAGK